MHDTYLQVHPKKLKRHTYKMLNHHCWGGGEEGLAFTYWSLLELTCTIFKMKHFTMAFLNLQIEPLSCPVLGIRKLKPS